MNKVYLREEIRAAINRASAENASGTPDFILADYLLACLDTFDYAVNAREKWFKGEGAALVKENTGKVFRTAEP